MAVVYALVVGVVTGGLGRASLVRLLERSGIVTATTLWVLAAASAFAWILVREWVPQTLGEWITGLGASRALRHAIGEVDRQVGLVSVRTLDDVLSQETAQPGFRTAVLSAVAGLAVALAAIGLSGVVGYSVSKRTAEIGVRVVLGAAGCDILWMVLREGLLLGAVGGAVGLAAAFALTRLLAGFLFGVTATDPLSFVLAAIFLVMVVLTASYLPARRASRIDPAAALRAE